MKMTKSFPIPHSPFPISSIPHPPGLTIIEMAIAATGLVMFIFVFTRVWSWTGGTIVQRQEKFQATRLAAGQPDCAGMPVGYQRPPIKLVGMPDTVGGDGTPDEGPCRGIGTPPCTAAEPYYERAKQLFEEADVLIRQAVEKSQEAAALGARLADLTSQIRVICFGGSHPRCILVGPFAEIDATRAQLDAANQEAEALRAQAQAKSDEGNRQLELGNAACL